MNEAMDINIIGEKTDYYLDQNIVLKVTMQYPQIRNAAGSQPLERINESYRDRAEQLWNDTRSTLLPEAIKFQQEPEPGRSPLPPYEVMLVPNLTYHDSCILSLYFDEYRYSGGAHGNTLRTSDTWNLNTGEQYQLKDFFAPGADYQSYLIDRIIQQINNQIVAGENVYFEDYQQLVKDTFSEDNFYLTGEPGEGHQPDGLVIYFQQYDIAPYYAGIREFFIPF